MNREEILKAVKEGANLTEADLHGAYLEGVDLREANLQGANLQGANLYGANLYGANLQGANLREADLRGAYLREANLREANFQGANLRGADLEGADLRGADLEGADLCGADLQGVDLREADLQGADLRGADLEGAYLRGAKDLDSLIAARLSIVSAGTIIGWKKVKGSIIKLSIPAEAQRSNATGRKCRAEFADVLEGEGYTENHGPRTEYRPGTRVYPDSWDPDRWDECSHGIHFFLTREEAEAYNG